MFTCTFLTVLFSPFKQAAKSINDVLDRSIIASPLILRYRDNKQHQQFFIICEKEVIVEVSSFVQSGLELSKTLVGTISDREILAFFLSYRVFN